MKLSERIEQARKAKLVKRCVWCGKPGCMRFEYVEVVRA